MVASESNGFQLKIVTNYIQSYEMQAPFAYFFSYQITIKNISNQTAQLVSRFWLITDGIGRTEEVKGLGVVGEQPIIEPGNSFTYTSGCPLISPFGTMQGHYTFLNLMTKQTFKVDIPLFELIPNFALN